MKVGDYVRTKDGIIDQVIIEYNGYCASPSCNCNHVSCRRNYYDEDKIIKSSPNIIDLIEVGDIVNDEKIIDIGCLTNGPEKGTKVIDYYIAPNTVYYLKNEDIKSIVTREQFSCMEYKIGE